MVWGAYSDHGTTELQLFQQNNAHQSTKITSRTIYYVLEVDYFVNIEILYTITLGVMFPMKQRSGCNDNILSCWTGHCINHT